MKAETYDLQKVDSDSYCVTETGSLGPVYPRRYN
jgi:hypothetical protein